MTKPEDIVAEKAVFAFEARIQGGEFEGLDPNGTDARDALKAEIRKAILSAVEDERTEKEAYREAIEKIADVDEAELARDPVWAIRVAGAARRKILAIRNRKES